MTALSTLNNKQAESLNKLLNEAVDSGAVKVADLLPGLNSMLSDPEQGGFPGKAFLGEVKAYLKDVEMPSGLASDPDATHLVDQLEVRDATGDYQNSSWAFFASNSGLKAKLSKLKNAKFVLFVYRGELEPTKKGWNPPKDYGMLEIVDLATGREMYNKIKDLKKIG
jgi:hypothetical protein